MVLVQGSAMTSYTFLMGIIFFVVNLFVYCTTMMPQLLYGPSGWEIRAGRGPATFVYQDSGRAAMNSPKQEHIHYDGGPYRGKRRGGYTRGRKTRSEKKIGKIVNTCNKFCRKQDIANQRKDYRSSAHAMGGEFRDKHRPYDDRGSRFRAQVEDDCLNSCIERKGNLKKRRSSSHSVTW